MKQEPIVIESHEENGVEWGVSFDGYNPPPEKYVCMVDKESAFKLVELIAK